MNFRFDLTKEAVAALLSFLKEIPEVEFAVFAPVQDARDAEKKRWAMGIYDKKNLGAEETILVGGLEFYIDPSMSAALYGQTLSYIDGAFVIV
ncbi:MULTISPECIES: hypothetical protein [unclassified Duganella]|uniref:hypothetical protein n=1 Tax=unclassified Duganella TaxID=2636909 RepID=UPI0006FEF817|nr:MULTISPECIES: hypothetical protein [unclassified Duganella]KQV46145.1 hypothetical protein ASD07_16925 [Duganella sp. Root336D2]KRB81812.1 hypothetical protein ASE26_15970 [Duganella sp. Root198D2]